MMVAATKVAAMKVAVEEVVAVEMMAMELAAMDAAATEASAMKVDVCQGWCVWKLVHKNVHTYEPIPLLKGSNKIVIPP